MIFTTQIAPLCFLPSEDPATSIPSLVTSTRRLVPVGHDCQHCSTLGTLPDPCFTFYRIRLHARSHNSLPDLETFLSSLGKSSLAERFRPAEIGLVGLRSRTVSRLPPVFVLTAFRSPAQLAVLARSIAFHFAPDAPTTGGAVRDNLDSFVNGAFHGGQTIT